MPADISEYGIHSGGAHDDDVVSPFGPGLVQQRARLPREEHAEREAAEVDERDAHAVRRAAGSSDDTASMPTWPRIACTNALHRKVAPTRQNTAASSCQSVDACRK